MKKIFFTLAVVVLSMAFISCKKVAKVDPVKQNFSNTYDSTNRIFRVKVTSANNVPFTVKIETTNPSKPGAVDIQQGNQSSGAAFEYPFTPAVGDVIKITAQSDKGDVYMYPLYKGAVLSGVRTEKEGDLRTATFDYSVNN